MNDTQNNVTADQQPSAPVREPLQPGSSGVGVSLDVDTIEPKRIHEHFVYSAKFLCGKIPHSLLDPQDPPPGFPLVPGTYRTAINIHNPNLSQVTIFKLAVPTNREGQPRGKAGTPVELSLGPNEGLEIDCEDIEELLTSGSGVELFNTWNTDAVFDGPPASSVFTLSDPARITQLATYHWHGGAGDPPGTIGLQDQSGNIFGPWNASGQAGPGGVANANWVADASQQPPQAWDGLVPAGTYRIVDSSPQTWSYNQRSQMAGFYIVRGSYSFVGKAPFFKGFVVVRTPELLDVVAAYTLKNVISSVPNPPLGPCPTITVSPVNIADFGSTFYINDLMGMVVDISGGQPPYSVVFTLSADEFKGVPYVLPPAIIGPAPNHAGLNWNVYPSGPPWPGVWLSLNHCVISVSVTDANGCKGQNHSPAFTIQNSYR